MKILQNFVAFSEYMNFNHKLSLKLLNCTCLTGTSSAFGELLLKNPSHGTQNASKNDVALPSLRSQDDSSFTFLWVKLLTDFFPPVSSTQQRRHIHTQPTTKHWCILSYFLSGLIFTGCSSSETLILISITLKMWHCDLTVILHFFLFTRSKHSPTQLEDRHSSYCGSFC